MKKTNMLPVWLLSTSLLVVFVVNLFGSNMFEMPKLVFLSIFVCVALFAIVISGVIRGGWKIRYNKWVYAVLGLWVFSLLLSTVFSIAPQQSFWGSYDRMQGLISHVIYLLFFLIFLNYLKNVRAREVFLKVLVGVSFVASLHAILQQFGIGVFSPGIMQEFLGRSFATMGHPNFLGQFLIFPLWAGLYFFLSRKGRARVVPGIATLIILCGLLLTQNRASVLGVVIGGLFLFMFVVNIKSIYKWFIASGLVAGFASFIFFVAPSMRSLTTRFHLWPGSLKAFTDHPFFGSGLETYKLVAQKYADSAFFDLEKLYSVADRSHNEFLDILVMQGAFGFIVFSLVVGGILFLFLKKVRKKNRATNYLLLTSVGAFISILVSNFFGFSLTSHYLLFASLVAILLNELVSFREVKIRANILHVFLAGVVFVLLSFVSLQSYYIISADNTFKYGMENIYDGEIDNGIALISDAAFLNPNQSNINFQISDVLFVVGREIDNQELLLEAERHIDLAGNFTNKGFRYCFAKARILTYQGKFNEAEKYYEKAIDYAPINPIIMKEWGAMYYMNSDYEKSNEKLELFLSLLPDYWEWKLELETLSFEDSEKYRLFFKHIPDFWDVFSYLARGHAELGDIEMAEYYLKFVEDKDAIEKIQGILDTK